MTFHSDHPTNQQPAILEVRYSLSASQLFCQMKFDTIVRRILRAFPLPQRTKKGYERGRGARGGLIPPFFSLFDFRSVRQDAQAGVNEWPNRGTKRRETTCEKTPRETDCDILGGRGLTHSSIHSVSNADIPRRHKVGTRLVRTLWEHQPRDAAILLSIGLGDNGRGTVLCYSFPAS